MQGEIDDVWAVLASGRTPRSSWGRRTRGSRLMYAPSCLHASLALTPTPRSHSTASVSTVPSFSTQSCAPIPLLRHICAVLIMILHQKFGNPSVDVTGGTGIYLNLYNLSVGNIMYAGHALTRDMALTIIPCSLSIAGLIPGYYVALCFIDFVRIRACILAIEGD